MTHVITVASSKGGVGKTTVAVNLASGLASLGRYYQPDNPFKVLLIDLDPNCNSIMTIGSGAGHLAQINKSLVALLRQTPPPSPQPIMKQADFHSNLWFIPSMRTRFAEFIRDELKDLPKREERLVRAIRPILGMFEFVIIDTPASSPSSYIFANAFMASTEILIAVEPGSLAVGGMQDLISEINRACVSLEREVRVLGIIPTKVKRRGSVGIGLSQQLSLRYTDLITSPSHMSEWVERMFLEHKDLFAYWPQYWEKRTNMAENEEEKTPVGEFGTIIIELLTRMEYEI